MKTLLVLVGILVVAATVRCRSPRRRRKPAPVPPDAVLTWNTYTVNAVRASTPTKVQTDGMVYMSYVQAAVYDAVTKLEGRYEPYHDFASRSCPAPRCRRRSQRRRGRRSTTTCPTSRRPSTPSTSAYLATLTGEVADGVAVGEAAANDIIAFRTGDGLKAATPSYGEIGPILPGQWQLQPGQAVQTPWLATMRPFLLEQASQFRAEPPPALTSQQYAKDLNETEAYGALDSTVRTPEQTAIAYFWVGNNINQYNRRCRTSSPSTTWISSTPRICSRSGSIVTTDAGIACFDSKFFYQFWRPITAIRNADKDGNPDTTADPTWQALLPVPGHPEYPSQHGCFTAAFSDALAAALHTKHLDVTMPGGQNGSTILTTTQHFDNVDDIQKQVVDARVWLGFHFRNSVEQGEKLGNDVADWELNRYFQPAPVARGSSQASGPRRAGHSRFPSSRRGPVVAVLSRQCDRSGVTEARA